MHASLTLRVEARKFTAGWHVFHLSTAGSFLPHTPLLQSSPPDADRNGSAAAQQAPFAAKPRPVVCSPMLEGTHRRGMLLMTDQRSRREQEREREWR